MRSFDGMNITDKEIFATTCQDLLSGKYILKDKNKKAYYFILKYKETFELYFNAMKYQLNVDSNLKCINLTSMLGKNKIRLTKNETIMLLVLRKLYEEHMRTEVTYNSDITISSETLVETIKTVLTKTKVNRTFLKDHMKRFKGLNLIYYDNKMENIVIYDSILMAVETRDIVTINDMIKDLEG